MKKNFNYVQGLCLLAFMAFAMGACEQQSKYPGPLSPEESLKTFQFADSFKAEIYATEPLIADPVSLVFDDNGDAYVVEMADANMPDSIKGRGQIVLLKDLDGDGRADSSFVFATGLTEATTVLPWKDGLIVTAAPNILYLKDTDGDNKADQREVLFSGFFQDNEEAQITSLRFGVDNWIYANNDGEPGQVVSHRNPEADTLSMVGADFRFRLDTKRFERTTGPGQYGQAIDDWGHRFFTKNSLHIQQVVVPWRYLHQHAHLPAAASHAIKNISDHDPIMYQLTPPPYWRAERTRRRNEKYQENNLNRTEYAEDHFTGASGGSFYGGDAYGEAYYGSIFTGDVSAALVHRDILAASTDPNDPFYTAVRGKGEQDKEFLAATDTWVRPTNFAVGPDGYLYMVDMYRQHIETPVSIPEDLQADMDFSAGSDKGRIYRIVPTNAGPYQKPETNLDAMSSADLVALLANPNRWQRLQAHKLLIERQDKTVIDAVKDLWQTTADARARIQALYVLEGLDALTPALVNDALTDSEAGIRENALILAERYPACLPAIEKCLSDASARVAFQATLSLGTFSGKQVAGDLIDVLAQRGANSWFRTAVLSAPTSSSAGFIKALLDQFSDKDDKWINPFVQDLTYMAGAEHQKSNTASVLALAKGLSGNTERQTAVLKGLVLGLKEAVKGNEAAENKLKEVDKSAGENPEQAIDGLGAILKNID